MGYQCTPTPTFLLDPFGGDNDPNGETGASGLTIGDGLNSKSLSEKSLERDLTLSVKGFGHPYPQGFLGDENRLFRPLSHRCPMGHP